MSKYGTPFLESDLILAANAEDWVEASRLIGELLPGERRRLYATLKDLEWELREFEWDTKVD